MIFTIQNTKCFHQSSTQGPTCPSHTQNCGSQESQPLNVSYSLTTGPSTYEENSGFAVCKPLMRAALLSPIFMLTPDHIAASLVRWSDWACPFIVRTYFTLSLVRM